MSQATPVLLGLGSNQGDRPAVLAAALEALGALLTQMRASAMYETAPMYVTAQPAFLNAVVSGVTALPPLELLTAVKAVEQRLGRTPTIRFGPRVIDIDILFYGEQTLDRPDLQVPHPAMAERAFVLIPAQEVAAAWRHPTTGLTVAEMRAKVDSGGVRRWGVLTLPSTLAAGDPLPEADRPPQ